MSKGRVDVMHNRASSRDQVACVTRYKYFFTKCSRKSSNTTEDENIILKAYPTQKVGSGRNFESGNQVYGGRKIQTHEGHMVYLIKLTQQKNANLILTRKCFTIAIKTIQLSSHITQHDEFIKATISSEIFFETNNIFVIRGKNPFPFYYVREDKKLNRVKLTYAIATK